MTNNGSNFGVLLATVLAAIFSSVMNNQNFYHYGWRIPFVIGGVLGVIGLWLRRDLQESDIFVRINQKMRQHFMPIKTVLQHHKLAVLKISLLLVISACGSYTLMNYLSTYLFSFIHYSLAQALRLQIIFILITFIFVPIFAWIADRYGRWIVLVFAGIGYLLFAVPCFYLLNLFQSWIVLLPLIIFYSAEQASTPILIVENFPARTRYTGVSIAYNITMAVVGGTAPLVNTWLIQYFDNTLMIAFHVIFCALISIFTLVLAFPTTYGAEVDLAV
jgi:MHS family proline/betaine transporter-like MFS transporter